MPLLRNSATNCRISARLRRFCVACGWVRLMLLVQHGVRHLNRWVWSAAYERVGITCMVFTNGMGQCPAIRIHGSDQYHPLYAASNGAIERLSHQDRMQFEL